MAAEFVSSNVTAPMRPIGIFAPGLASAPLAIAADSMVAFLGLRGSLKTSLLGSDRLNESESEDDSDSDSEYCAFSDNDIMRHINNMKLVLFKLLGTYLIKKA